MKKIIVTGCSQGIGLFVANELVKLNYEVFGISRKKPTSEFKFNFIECDISNSESVKEVFSIFRRDIDVYALINVAGVASMNLLMSTPDNTIKRIIETNLLGSIYCTKAIIPPMIKSKMGRIINFSSIAVRIGAKGEATYIASKGGVEAFSRSIARELSPANITVNTISPAYIETRLSSSLPATIKKTVIERQIIESECSLSDVFDCVKLILSPESKKITGEIFNIGGV
ncbi:SDR family oxidoreductase [bacterium]|nr:SDR family oxidoreductase [bacterium]